MSTSQPLQRITSGPVNKRNLKSAYCSRLSYRCLLVFLALIINGLVVSHAARAQIESSGFPVVQLDETARIAALGGRSPALMTRDPGSMFSNPALLSYSSPRSFSFSYLNHIGSANAGWVSYAVGIDSLTTAGIGFRYLGFGTMPRADEEGNRDGTFNASDMSLTVGASRRSLPGLTYGANINFLFSSIDGIHSSALTADAGIFYAIDSKGVTLGASIHHAGFVLSSFGSRRDQVPLDVRLGITKKLAHMPLLLSLAVYRLHKLDGSSRETDFLNNALYHLVVGGEFLFSESFQIRFGYNHRRHDELRMKSRLDLAGFSMGFGLDLSRVGIDYGFNSWSSLGGLHRFTIRTRL